jgi:membrane-bound serine protease (ClpP class)
VHGAVAALVVILALATAPWAAARTLTQRAAPGGNRVLVVRIDGPITPVTAEALDRAVGRAEREGYAALVVEVDTPGGLESSMRNGATS